jgi:hypothetical protein
MDAGLDARAAYKLGFLTRCAEEGLSAQEVNSRIEKTAEGILSRLTSLPGAALIGAVPVGFGAGYLLSDITAPPADTPEDIKYRELMAAYRRATDRARNITRRMQDRSSMQPRMPRLPSSLMG